ncbi:MAG: DUF2304 domain-containing protein [Bacteroidales bacterium]|nr:DUF2304 domain-containing protein [Bacteroidales bacterium]
MDSFSIRIQIISIIVSVLLLFFSGRLIVKGKLRVEYSIFWFALTVILVVFSFWRDGLEFFSKLLGVYEAPNLVFLVAIGSVFLYLLHFSIVISKLKDDNRKLAQDIALLKEKIEKKD